VLLDEPTVGVDPQSRNRIFESIEQLHREGITIVYTTHYMEEASRLCDRVGIIDHGRLLALDTVDALLRSHGGPTAVIVEREEGETRIETADPIGEIIRFRDGSGGGPGNLLQPGIRNIRLEAPDLESVFLRLTGRHLRD
jgi:ABC-2 type transport system ATP-binding protein